MYCNLHSYFVVLFYFLRRLLLLIIFLVKTLHESLGKFGMIQSLSNKDKLIDTFFVLAPRCLGGTKVNLFVNTLKDHFVSPCPWKLNTPLVRYKSAARSRSKSIMTKEYREETRMSFVQDSTCSHHWYYKHARTHVEPLRMKIALELHSNGLHQFQIMFGIIFRLRFKKGRIVIQNGFHIETVETQNLVQWCTTAFCFHDRDMANLLIFAKRSLRAFFSSSVTRSTLLRRILSANATCWSASLILPSGFTSSRCKFTCLASAKQTILSMR